MSTLYASFVDAPAAERAAGALLDHGARSADISIVAHSDYIAARTDKDLDAGHAERSAKEGISTTTAADAAVGATKGAAIGLGVGIAAALAALIVPGVGIVIGGGALATAIAGGAATVAAGAAAGGVAGYLKDQGVPDEMVTKYSNTFYEGGAILALAVPTGDIDAIEAEAILAKYAAVNIATYNSTRVLADGVVQPVRQPMVMTSDNLDMDPVVLVDKSSNAVDVVTPPIGQVISDRATGERTVIEADVVGVPTRAVALNEVTTLSPTHEVIVDQSGVVHQTVGHPTKIDEHNVVVVDADGVAHEGKLVEEQRAVVTEPTLTDASGRVVRVPGAVQTTVVRESHLEVEE
jgi:hypothetical protein